LSFCGGQITIAFVAQFLKLLKRRMAAREVGRVMPLGIIIDRPEAFTVDALR